ncbi:homeobox transcription factor [Moniliophthora roreri]|nr:homeobox transcription factor [Moniliophthora roreri]
MNAKDPHLVPLMSATRSSRRGQLHVDPTALPKSLDKESNVSTPLSATATDSPITPLTTPTFSTSSESADYDAREHSSTSHMDLSDILVREKRKRCRVTPDQLKHLERIFATDRSPTAARRREISEILGMQERQTQVWFQNRRAKAKMMEAKLPATLLPTRAVPNLPSTDEVDLVNLVHEDEMVEVIPCTDLAVGSWRRIASSTSNHDLIAYLCNVKQCLTWFVLSDGSGFKMELPFATVVDAQFTSSSGGSGIAKITLTEPPVFYLEHSVPSAFFGTEHRSWRRCSDWTEGAQASRILQHELQGPAVHLAYLVRTLLTHRTSRTASPIHQATVEIPAPPLAGLRIMHSHPSISQVSDEPSDPRIPGTNAPSYGSVTHNHAIVPPVVHYPQPSTPLHTNVPRFPQNPYPQTHSEPIVGHSSWAVPDTHQDVPRSLSTHPPNQSFYPNVGESYRDPRSFQTHPYHNEDSGGLPVQPQPLTLLTTPFYPNFDISQNQNISRF